MERLDRRMRGQGQGRRQGVIFTWCGCPGMRNAESAKAAFTGQGPPDTQGVCCRHVGPGGRIRPCGACSRQAARHMGPWAA